MKNFSVLLFLLFTLPALAQDRTADPADTTRKGFPILNSYVEVEFIERAKKQFGRSLYSIAKGKMENCQNAYLLGLIRNGRLTMRRMCGDLKMVRRSGRNVLDERTSVETNGDTTLHQTTAPATMRAGL